MSSSNEFDVVIIGAGPGGLASAMLLAQSGVRVRVIERLERVGGRNSAIEQNGFRFSVGPTYYQDPSILDGIFQSVGDRLLNHVELLKLEPYQRIHYGTSGTTFECSSDIARVEAEVAKISPEDAKNVRRFIEENRRKLECSQPLLTKEAPSLLSWLPTVLKRPFLFQPWSDLESYLKKFFKHEYVRRAFSFQSRYVGMAPNKCPSLFSILGYLEYSGVYHPVGGCPSLSEAMAKVARRMGVEISTGEEVESIQFVGRRATGVRTNRGEYKTKTLVINAEALQALTRLVPEELRRKWTNKTIERKQLSCSVIMMYLGIEGRYEDLHHHSVFLPDDLDKSLRMLDEELLMPEDAQFYVNNPSLIDPTLAPKGMSSLYVSFTAPNLNGPTDWTRERPRMREYVLRALEKAGLEDLSRRIVFEKTITPIDWQQDYEVYRGAVFSMAHTLPQLMHGRPQNKFEDLESVYLVGGGTHPGCGLPIIFESAKISSRLLLDELGVATNWLNQPAHESRHISEPHPA